MGTRGCIGFRIDGKDKVTYNHFDSYPSGIGKDIVNELKAASVEQLSALPNFVRNIKMLSGNSRPTAKQIEMCKKWTDLGVSEQSVTDWYCLLRNAQGSLKPYIDGELAIMVNYKTFLYDSLFCEYAYIVNLDNGTLEFYKGFNQSPTGDGRYASKQINRRTNGRVSEYYGVVLVDTIPLCHLVQMETDDIVAKWEKPR
jgi:hypothetical protein